MYKYLLFLVFPVFMFSQSQKISGTVFNVDKEKLDSVKVELYNHENTLIKSFFTDSEGRFSFDSLSSNFFKLKINDEKYLSFEKNIEAKNEN